LTVARRGLRVRLSAKYATLAAVIFALEVLIAVYLHDAFVRPLVGDALVVVLVYAAVLAVVELPAIPVVLGAFVFACAIEVGQYFELVKLLHLQQYTLARVVIGTSYDARDFAAYATGASLVVAAVLARSRFTSVRR
jgi:hypothetical protein